MFIIDQSGSTTKMTLTKGDTATFTVQLKDSEGNNASAPSGATIRFAAKKNYSDETLAIAAINATINSSTGVITFKIPKTATANLEVGSYVFDIQMTAGSGSNEIVDTFIAKGKLIISEEVA